MYDIKGLPIEKAAIALIDGESDRIANICNLSALIPLYIDRINWAGFYILQGETLVLGPFQGKPACVRILLGKGVCGTAAKEGKALIVDDVEAFPGHIACDSASRSEIVIPVIKDGKVYGVIDVDSPEIGRFGDKERIMLENLAEIAAKVL